MLLHAASDGDDTDDAAAFDDDNDDDDDDQTDVLPVQPGWARALVTEASKLGCDVDDAEPADDPSRYGSKPERSEPRGGGRAGYGGASKFWQLGSPPRHHPSFGELTARRDFHLNGNALYVLGCGGFEARRRNAMALWTDPSRLSIIHYESLSYGLQEYKCRARRRYRASGGECARVDGCMTGEIFSEVRKTVIECSALHCNVMQ